MDIKRRAYNVHKSQARFRNEEYYITLDQYKNLWTDELWERKKVGREDRVCLVRKSQKLPWAIDNVEIISMREQRGSKIR